MAKSDAKKIGTFFIFAVLLAGVLGYIYFTGRSYQAVYGTQLDLGKQAFKYFT